MAHNPKEDPIFISFKEKPSQCLHIPLNLRSSTNSSSRGSSIIKPQGDEPWIITGIEHTEEGIKIFVTHSLTIKFDLEFGNANISFAQASE